MMRRFKGETLSWEVSEGIVELALHRPPCNEIGSVTLDELERFVETLDRVADEADALIVYSALESGFSAGADLQELYRRSQSLDEVDRVAGVRHFLLRIHRVMNLIDSTPLTTIAAVHGVTFGGGFELALTCDLIIADKSTRFCFPELRLGLIPGFGGIPRLKRDLGNSVVRDLLLTGRSMNGARALAVGLISQLVAEGQSLNVARMTAAQIRKFDRETRITAKRFIKSVPTEELEQEIDLFCELLRRPAVDAGLRKFVESTDVQPYLP
jgi:enoyl-CoA hydratase/carnithine racemase